MEFINGESLAERLRRDGPLPVAEACAYVRQAALGLQHAHDNGLVHRDVKPHNLMLVANPDASSPGVVKVLDFGLAALADDGGQTGGRTGPNAVMGTPDYMAPEQAEDARSADGRADVYSLGCTLFHLLTGEVPFPMESTLLKLLAHRTHERPSARRTRPDVSPGLNDVIRKAMAKRPEERHQTPGELAAALAPFTDPAYAARENRRRRLRMLLALAALVTLTAVGAAGVTRLPAGKDREIEIRTDDPDIEVIVQGDRIVRIVDPKTGKAYRLDRNDLTLTRADDPDGLTVTLDGEKPITLKREGKLIVTVRLDRKRGTSGIEQAEKEFAKWQGAWEYGDWKLYFKGDRFFWGNRNDTPKYANVLKIIEVRETMTLVDFLNRDEGSPDKGKTGKLILRRDGDTLYWCGSYGPDRPTEFVKEWGPVYYYVAWKRVKDSKPPAQEKASEVGRFKDEPVKPLHQVRGVGPHTGLRISPDGRYFLAARPHGAGFTVWDTQSGKVVLERKKGWAPWFTQDSRQIVTYDTWNDLRLLDVATGRQVDQFNSVAQLYNLYVPAAGTRVLVTTANGIQVWDWKSGKKLRDFPADVGPLTPDLGYAYTKTKGGPWQVFDVATGKEVNAFAAIRDLPDWGFTLDMKQVLYQDGRDLKVCDVASGKLLRTLALGPDDRYLASGDGRRILTTSRLRDELQVLDVTTGELLARLRFPEENNLERAALSGDGRHIVVGGPSDSVYVFHLPEPPAPEKRTGRDKDKWVPLFNGRDLTGWVVDGGDGDAWRVEDGELVGMAARYPDIGWLLTEKSYADFVLQFEFQLSEGTNSGVALRAVPGEKNPKNSRFASHLEVQILDDGKYRRPDGTVDCPTGSLFWAQGDASYLRPDRPAGLKQVGFWNEMKIEARGDALRVWVNGQRVLDTDLNTLANQSDSLPGLKRKSGRIGFQRHTGAVRFRDIEIKELPLQEPSAVEGRVPEPVEIRERRWMAGHTAMARMAVFTPDGKRYYSCGDDKTVRAWDMATGKELQSWDFPGPVRDLMLLPDGKGLVALTDRRPYRWRPTGDEQPRGLDAVPDGLMKAAVNPDGSKVVVGSVNGTVRIWDLSTGKIVREWQPGPLGEAVNGAIGWSSDGTRIVTGGDAGGPRGGWVEVWDAESGDRIRRWENRTGTNDAAFTPAGRRVVSSEWGGRIQVRDVDSGETVRTIDLGGWGAGVVLAPDGRRALLLPGKCESAGLWDLETGRQVAKLDARGRFAWDGAFSPDGKFAVTCGWDGSLRLWRLPDPPAPEKRTDADGDKWRSLFNGFDLSGWSIDGPNGDQWSVEGGAIVGRSDSFRTRSYLLSDKGYADFVLRFDYKVEDGHHGVALRAIEGERLPYGDALVADHPLIKLTDPTMDAAEPTGTTHWLRSAETYVKPVRTPPLPGGVWRTMEVVVRGGHCKATIDGEPVVNVTLDTDARKSGAIIPGLKRAKGKVGFQTNTGAVRFRNIKVKELSSPE